MEAAKRSEAVRDLRLPRIALPPYTPPDVEELERRRALYEATIRLRDKIGPLPVSVTDLIRQDRESR